MNRALAFIGPHLLVACGVGGRRAFFANAHGEGFGIPTPGKRSVAAIVMLTLVFLVLDTVQGTSGWGRLVASADRPAQGSVHALFDLNAPVTGPFPSDWFTMADTSHNTGRRVSLPMPDCETRRPPAASERSERATRTERAGAAACEGACRGVRGAKPLG